MAETFSIAQAAQYVVVPDPTSDKYSRGVVGFATGSEEYPGAAVLGVTAALRTGVGMVRSIGPAAVTNLVLASRPEVVVLPGQVQAWVVGSGLIASGQPASIVTEALSSGLPVVVDAGSLRELDRVHGPAVATPHAWELARLLASVGYEVSPSQILANPDEFALAAAEKFNCTFLVKGHRTVLADQRGRVIKMGPASSWLATAGSGDVLAGIIGALIATNHRIIATDTSKLIEIAASAVAIHTAAAELQAQQGPILALELANRVSEIVAKLLGV